MENNYYNQSTSLAKKWYQKRWGKGIIVFFVLLLVILAFLIFIFFKLVGEIRQSDVFDWDNLDQQTIDSDALSAERLVAEKSDRPYLGNENADLVIVEFGDFLCPKCGEEFQIIRELINKYPDNIKYIYRHYPVYENSLLVAQAAMCAHDQDKFWQMHDRLFLKQGMYISQASLTNTAQQAGLDVDLFDQCIVSEKYNDYVVEDAQDGYNLGSMGTPTFFINGNKISGVITEEKWEEIVNKFFELTQSGD